MENKAATEELCNQIIISSVIGTESAACGAGEAALGAAEPPQPPGPAARLIRERRSGAAGSGSAGLKGWLLGQDVLHCSLLTRGTSANRRLITP